jgi:hypothetical protein
MKNSRLVKPGLAKKGFSGIRSEVAYFSICVGGQEINLHPFPVIPVPILIIAQKRKDSDRECQVTVNYHNSN